MVACRTKHAIASIGAVLLSHVLFAQPTIRPIPPGLLDLMASQGQASYLVVLRDRADLSAATATNDRQARGRLVYQALKSVAESSQRPLLDLLKVEAAAGRVRQVRPFFSVNAIGITSGEATLRRLASFPQVDQVLEVPAMSIPQPMPGAPEASIQSVEWNIAKVRAPEVWDKGFTGQGIVVASLDTGVQFDHPALVNHYRGNVSGVFNHNYSWWDATGACPLAPCDDNQHGTHTTGTMVGSDGGSNRIGVAPGATWIACKALNAGGAGNIFDLLECGDWILAPWDLQHQNPDPDRRPHIVNNSWGLAVGGFPFFLPAMVANWRAAGIFPAFAAGNNGPGCGTATSPGDYVDSFASGAADMNDVIASFSSRGPSAFGGVIKPDVTAPGVNVRSSVPGNAYATFSGTSMASPHTAGLVALLWSEYPSLLRDIANTERKLRPAAVIVNSAQGCGGKGPTEHPNNVFGWGRVDALETHNSFPVYTNRSLYHAGDALTVSVSLVNSASAAVMVDAYLGFQVPSGQVALFPYGTITIPASAEIFDIPQVSATLTGSEPLGTYLSFTVLVPPGADPFNPANHLSLDLAPFVIQ